MCKEGQQKECSIDWPSIIKIREHTIYGLPDSDWVTILLPGKRSRIE